VVGSIRRWLPSSHGPRLMRRLGPVRATTLGGAFHYAQVAKLTKLTDVYPTLYIVGSVLWAMNAVNGQLGRVRKDRRCAAMKNTSAFTRLSLQ
jgi:hypothetical protein